VVIVELSRSAATELASALGGMPPPGFTAFRRDSGIGLGGRLDPAWLAEVGKRSGCSAASWLGDLFRFGHGWSSWQLAGSDFRIGPSSATMTGAIYLGFRDRSLGERALELIPQRKLFARARNIRGVEVHEIDLPGLPGLPEVTWTLDDHSLCIAVGEGVIERVLAPARGESSLELGTEIAIVEVTPGWFPDLEGSLSALTRLASVALGAADVDLLGDDLSRYDSGQLRLAIAIAGVNTGILASQLSRCESARLRLAIDGESLVLTGRIRLR